MKINHETKKNPVIIALLIATGMLSGKKEKHFFCTVDKLKQKIKLTL